MSFSVLRKGQVIMSNFSTFQEAQKYVDEQCTGFFGGIDESKKREYEIKDDGGCYLTTAAVSYMGLSDDCEELNSLRNFRDTYLKSLPNGTAEINHYYSVAPKIVKKIGESSNKELILNSIYNDLILPSVKSIKENKLDKVYQQYKKYTLELEKELFKK